jgi:hypothetical protein
MPRTTYDCHILTASLVEWTEAEMVFFLGMVTSEYRKVPDAVFWDILERFSRDRINARIVRPSNT